MELLRENKLNTTTMLAVDSSTDTAAYLFNGNTALGYISDGYIGNSVTTISISFSAATILSHVLIQHHNLKDFSVYYNGTTTNQLFTIAGNSDTSTYIEFASTTVSSIQLRMSDVMVSIDEKKVGELVLTERILTFERDPDVKDYDPKFNRAAIVHNMPDGGTKTYHVKDKFQIGMEWTYLSKAFRDDLRAVYNASRPVVFVETPTSTAWDGLAYEMSWIGDFNFHYSSNIKGNGFSGSILLRESASG